MRTIIGSVSDIVGPDGGVVGTGLGNREFSQSGGRVGGLVAVLEIVDGVSEANNGVDDRAPFSSNNISVEKPVARVSIIRQLLVIQSDSGISKSADTIVAG